MYTHRALFHDGNEELVAELVPFVTEGIEADERVVVVVSSAVGDLLRERIGPELAFDLWNSTDVYTYPVQTLAAYVDTVRAATEQGRRMRVAGQPIWSGLSPLATTEWTCVEAACNVVFADSPLLMLCPYDTSRLDPAVIAAARRTHPEIHHGSHLATSPEFSPADHQSGVRSSGLPLRPASSEQISMFSSTDLSAVLSFVEDFARTRATSAGRITDLQLALEELLTRSIDYRVGAAQLHIWTTDDELVVEVESSGLLASPFAGYLPPSTSSPAAEEGLWLAGQKCDLIAVRQHNGHTTVRLHIADYLVASRPACEGIDKMLGVFAMGACDADEESRVAAHVSTCAECRAEVDRLARLVGLMEPPDGSTSP